jgi:hypothetical protein
MVVIGSSALIQQDFNVLAMRNALPVLIVCVAGAAWLYRILPDRRTMIWVGALAGLVLTAIGSWNAMERYPFQGQEQAFVRAIKSGGAQEGSNSIGGFRVGTKPEQQMAAYVNANVRGHSTILGDNAQTFGVIVLSGRPQLFFDRVDRGDGVFRQTVLRPYGRVRYMLMAKHANGDLIRRRYPTTASRTAAGLTPVFETERYLLLKLAGRDPRLPRSGSSKSSSGEASGQVGGRATPAAGRTATP